MKPSTTLPVAVIGAGPVGLAAVAHLLDRGIESVVLERAANVGGHLQEFGHVRLFSPWRYNLDKAMKARLLASEWTEPDPDELPTAGQLLDRSLRPFAALPEVAPRLRLRSRVVAITRSGLDKVKTHNRSAHPFLVRYIDDEGAHELLARAVIDVSGTWSQPNPLGSSGIVATGEREHHEHIFYGIPDILGIHRSRYAGKRVLVVGAGHSAANSLLALAQLAEAHPGTRLVWAVRGQDATRAFGGGVADALPARGQLGSALKALRAKGGLELVSDFHIRSITSTRLGLSVVGSGADSSETRIDVIDEIIAATGQRPDLSLTRELRLDLDPQLESTTALGPLIDPNVHSCGTVRPHGHRELAHPEPGFYTAGVKSYGRAPTFLLATGFEQVRSIAAALSGDLKAADEVHLDLPETGVCSSRKAPEGEAACCA
ncbi:MAG: NAD(P)-binding protein [Vicinamibacteria bacterium]|nr:NAD(P)-binding protein [Vicinamibacteria bacterium]